MCFCALEVTDLRSGEVFSYGTENLQWILGNGTHSSLIGNDPATKLDVAEDIDTLVGLLGGTFVKVTDLQNGATAFNKFFVKHLRSTAAGKAVLFTTTNYAFYLDETYATVKALLAPCAGAGSIVIDGVTIIAPGGIHQVGEITGDHIADGSVEFVDIQDMNANRLLGRLMTDGTPGEVFLEEGDGMDLIYSGPPFNIRFNNTATGVLAAGATGALLYKSRLPENHEFKGILAGAGVAVNVLADDVEIVNDGVIDAENVGTGTFDVLSGVVANVAQFKTITPANGVAIVDSGNTLTISATAPFTWENITVDPLVAFTFLVRCTNPLGVTLTKGAVNEFVITIPNGVDVTDVCIHLSAVNNPGSDVFLQFDFQGNNSKNLPRETNLDTDTVILPSVRVANKQLAALFPPVSRTNYIRYGVTQGAGVLEVRLTDFSPLELWLVNFNQAGAAGNAEAIIHVSNL